MANQIHNIKPLLQHRRDLRATATPEETLLWKYLRTKQLAGRYFRRQHSIGNYIVDFYCSAEDLIIVLDGAEHFTNMGKEYDADKTNYFASLNLRVIRFENSLVRDNIQLVLKTIRQHFYGAR